MPHYLTNIDPQSYYNLREAVELANKTTGERIELHEYPMPLGEHDWGDNYSPSKVPGLWSLYAPDDRHDLSKWWSVLREFARSRGSS